MLTIFTPAYNREKELKRLYESLLEQDFLNFEWLIVDDGSVDNTEQVVSKMVKDKKIAIRYVKQENRGKSCAVNHGIDLAEGELFFCIDSDDFFVPNVLKKVWEEYEKIRDDEEIAGIGFLHWHTGTENVVGTEYPCDGMVDTYFNIYNKHGVKGDKQFAFKTSVMRKYKFPEIPNEKFVPEALLFNRISNEYKMVFFNTSIVYKEYLESGYTSRYFDLAKRNPQGQALYYKELYKLCPTLYNVAAYDMFCIYAKKRMFEAVKEHPNRLLSLLMYFPAYIKYLQKESKK
ncbi:MAG: glycosyltransferase family 2 protein [Clostridia bacterium]|nr:glycosyltransferase family 2 protein [Clostridia bacterium]